MKAWLVRCADKAIKPAPTFEDRTTNKYIITSPDGVSIYTNPNRLSESDEFLIRNLLDGEEIYFGDFGAASGITTLELHNKCRRLGLNIQSLSMDLVQNLYRHTRLPFHVFYDAQGNPRQYKFFSLTILFANNRISRLMRLPTLIDQFVKAKAQRQPEKFSILHKDAYVAAKRSHETNFHATELDFTKNNSKLNGHFNLMRFAHCFYQLASNDEALVTLLLQINSFSKGKGTKLMIVENENVASIFTHTGKHFEKVDSLNGGVVLEEKISKVLLAK